MKNERNNEMKKIIMFITLKSKRREAHLTGGIGEIS